VTAALSLRRFARDLADAIGAFTSRTQVTADPDRLLTAESERYSFCPGLADPFVISRPAFCGGPTFSSPLLKQLGSDWAVNPVSMTPTCVPTKDPYLPENGVIGNFDVFEESQLRETCRSGANPKPISAD
jgi:hypothetical protein